MQMEDAEYAARKGFSKHRVPLPLFDSLDVHDAIATFSPTPFQSRTQVSPEAFITFHRAAHILGSAFVELEIEGKRIVFSGDLGRKNHPILCNPDPLPGDEIDALLVESTYGDRRHELRGDALADVINKTIKRGGHLLIPAFAVDRTEVILHRLKTLIETHSIPHVPIYVDSPMALASLDIYRRAFERKSLDIDSKIKIEGDPFDRDLYKTARSVEESKALAELRVPSIIISASGMATGGRVLHHLRRLLPDPRNTIVLVGYQSVGTRGRSLADGAKSVKMFGSLVDVKAEISKINEFSVHADSEEMIEWLRTSKKEPKQVFIVHGEEESGSAFRTKMETQLGWKSVIPNRNQSYRI